ncbi:hypothetical protein IFR05_007815 [Cadophora sp. M221]|nr:hypothetical protein IFR05_007815 [Cadophora sp. M221]
MKLTTFLSSATVVLTATAYLEPPPTTAASDTIQDCSWWEVATSKTQCESIQATWFITAAQFKTYNPSALSGTTCNLVVGNSYCVEQNYSVPPVVTSTSTSKAPTPTGNGISTPTPTQTGMVTSCNAFYFVVSGDDCTSIASKKGITLANFYAWNPAVGNTCATLWADVYVCVGIIGSTTITTSKGPTTTAPSNGIATPSPIRSGMTQNCNTFYFVKEGDECGTIASSKGISIANFYTWNPAVGTSCTALWANTYVCVNVIGGSTSKSSTRATTTSKPAGNGITTPSPIQTGMVTNCNTFYLVKSGDQCGTIASSKGISLAQFYAWNPAVGNTCASLWLDTYVCVNVIGGTTTTSQKPTTTTAGNGVATPTPIQTGMITSCKKFKKVVSGDQCGTIATAAGITLANFYKWNPGVGSTCASLWLDYYVCIGI